MKRIDKPLVVMVDDRPSDLEINRYVLKRISDNLDIESFTRGVDAIKYLEVLKDKRIEPDLILVDLQMPSMSGVEVIEIIKSKLNISTPTIAFSSSSLSEDALLSKQHGASEFFVKPLTYDENHTFFSFLLNKYLSNCTAGASQRYR